MDVPLPAHKVFEESLPSHPTSPMARGEIRFKNQFHEKIGTKGLTDGQKLFSKARYKKENGTN
jgi:hypothetical protein